MKGKTKVTGHWYYHVLLNRNQWFWQRQTQEWMALLMSKENWMSILAVESGPKSFLVKVATWLSSVNHPVPKKLIFTKSIFYDLEITEKERKNHFCTFAVSSISILNGRIQIRAFFQSQFIHKWNSGTWQEWLFLFFSWMLIYQNVQHIHVIPIFRLLFNVSTCLEVHIFWHFQTLEFSCRIRQRL